ncbi:hypothetical protein N7456_004631 [Penicillium angulare]|uniref:Uncharacterized protein n=1 Tax=Penicillium angulare TaxID=116970 RepID=A0A9W9KJD1_9EURO|nr:hypothetical protein N7456_004631 [Penicillium angulare]
MTFKQYHAFDDNQYKARTPSPSFQVPGTQSDPVDLADPPRERSSSVLRSVLQLDANITQRPTGKYAHTTLWPAGVCCTAR